jgi:hypothetical protein
MGRLVVGILVVPLFVVGVLMAIAGILSVGTCGPICLAYGVGGGVAIAGYLLPTVVALLRNHRIGEVFLINTFLGFTFLGWFWALMLAVSSPTIVHISAQISAPISSPDGKSWWDGSAWRPIQHQSART